MHYLLFYEFVPDYLQRRPQYRSEHLNLAWQAQAKGQLLLAGAYDDPADGAALLFQCDSPSIPQSFAAADPYVRAGLVVRWHVRAWNTVVGTTANNPVRPAS